MADNNNEELLPDATEGFKVGEKKTLDEYAKMGMFRSPFSVSSSTWLSIPMVL